MAGFKTYVINANIDMITIFAHLVRADQLRGCSGSLSPSQSTRFGSSTFSERAADSNFPGVVFEELDEEDIADMRREEDAERDDITFWPTISAAFKVNLGVRRRSVCIVPTRTSADQRAH